MVIECDTFMNVSDGICKMVFCWCCQSWSPECLRALLAVFNVAYDMTCVNYDYVNGQVCQRNQIIRNRASRLSPTGNGKRIEWTNSNCRVCAFAVVSTISSEWWAMAHRSIESFESFAASTLCRLRRVTNPYNLLHFIKQMDAYYA